MFIDEDRAEWYAKKLNWLQEVWDHENLAGLYDALACCENRDDMERGGNGARICSLVLEDEDFVKVPRWVLEGALHWMKEEIEATKCPTKQWVKAYRRDMKHLARYDAVFVALDHRIKWTDGEVHEWAAEFVNDRHRLVLEDSDQRQDSEPPEVAVPKPTTPGAVQESYKKVQREIQKEPCRYYESTYIRPRKKK